jgi:raffinose/stachyose/melibiose transport system permease protein
VNDVAGGRPLGAPFLRRRTKAVPSEFEVPRTGSAPRRLVVKGLEQAFMVGAALVSLLPLYAMAVVSLKSTKEFNASPSSLAPSGDLGFAQYAEAWSDLGFSTMLRNSLLLSGVSAVVTTLLAAIASFSLARLGYPGKRLVLVAMIVFMSVPAIVVLVPLFAILSGWDLINTYLAAPLAEIGLLLPFAIYLVYTFMMDLPEDLFAAAAVDGATTLRQFLYVAVPLSRPVLLTVALISGIFAWNDLLVPLILWQSEELQVLMVGLANLAPGQTGSVDVPLVMAGVSISVFPILGLFLLARQMFIEGFLGGAVKS